MFLSCLIDEDTNREAADESKNNLIAINIMTIQISVMHSLQAFMSRSNGQSNDNK